MTRRRRSVEDSLDAFSRLHVSISIEERVMASVRAEAARRRALAHVSRRRKAVLGGAAAFGLLAEGVAWVAIGVVLSPAARLLAQMFGRPVGTAAYEIGRPVVDVLPLTIRLLATLGRVLEVVWSALSTAAPSPTMIAALFVSLVLALTFFTVRRDLQRSPATVRGLR